MKTETSQSTFFAISFVPFWTKGDVAVVFAGGLVGVIDFRAEDFVFAVFGPGLRENFELDVGRFAESVLRAVLRGAEIILNGFHFLKGQRERSGTADIHEFFIGDFEVDEVDFPAADSVDDRLVERHSVFRDFLAGENFYGFDQLVRENSVRDGFDLFAREILCGEHVFDGAVDVFGAGELAADDVADRFARGAADVVGDAGAESDGDDPVEVEGLSGSGFSDAVILKNRIGEFGGDLFRLFLRDVRGDGEDVPGADFFNVAVKEIVDFLEGGFASGVMPFGLDRDFNSVIHSDHLLFCYKNHPVRYTGNAVFSIAKARKNKKAGVFAPAGKRNPFFYLDSTVKDCQSFRENPWSEPWQNLIFFGPGMLL